MMIVAHNLSAMNAQRQFGINTKNKTKSAEKLSSGYKINRAADDAAGLSISEKMRKQIRGLTQGVANAQDGVSLCQVADGALAEVNDMLHRITELSVKSANGTNSEQDRQYIQNEINEILKEIDRIGDTTCFNELHIFKEEKVPSAETPSVEAPSTPIITPPSTPGTGTTPAVDYEALIRDSLVVSGTPSNIAQGTYTVTVTDQGMTINGTTVAWSEVKDTNGNAMNVNAIAEGKYQFEYNGLTIAFETSAGATLDDVIQAVDGTEFQVGTRNKAQDAVSITGITITPGTKTDELLSGNPLGAGKTAYIEADTDGIAVKPNSYSAAYTKMTWAQMGIDDWSNAGGKTFSFSDSVTGITFTGQIADGATKDEAIESMNAINFKWDYIDRDTSSSSFKLNGIKVPTNGGSITNKLTEVKLSDMMYAQYGGNSDFYAKMGYTTPSEIVNGIEISVSLTKNTAGELALKITSAKGNEYIEPLNTSKTSELSQSGYALAAFGDFSNTKDVFNIITVGTKGYDAKKTLLERFVGQEIATVKLPGPYKYSISPKKVTRTETYLSSYTTNEGKNTNTNPNPTPDPPNPTNPTPSVPDNPNREESSDRRLRLWIQSGCEAGDGMFLEIDSMSTSTLGIDSLDVTTADGAYHAMDAVEEALRKVTANRSKIGAQQNRLEHTIANEENVVENTTAAESRIRDTDMAKEMVRYSNLSVLEQVGNAMMAQANQSNQGVLALLS